MALRRTVSKHIFFSRASSSPAIQPSIEPSQTSPPSSAATHNPAKTQFRREFITSADSSSTGFFRRFLQRRAINNHSTNALPAFLTLPVGDKLKEKLKSLNVAGEQRLRLDDLSARLAIPPAEREEFGVTAADVKRVLRFVQLEKIRERLRNIPASTVPYGEFVRICGDASGNKEAGLEMAKALDECGNVVVLGGIVFLRPDQVAKSMETLISQSIGMPNDPRRKELEQLEYQKAQIDQKAQYLVRGELYCGLGFLVLQTLGFMRLTFWELSWDVMEPICFFVTSLHFALAYGFFLRTSKEPSFEGYFQRRFKVKQKKLMKIHNFDLGRYNELCEVFYPNNFCNQKFSKALDSVRGMPVF